MGDDTGRPDAEPPLSGAGGRVTLVVRRFIATEAAGGAVLLAAAMAALTWANSPWRASYEALWTTDLVGDDLRHWVNEGLMTLFFFVVGLEIKRELVHGELRDRRVAATPVIAAAGGMAIPALVYLAVAGHSAGARGWAIPMATDIAFALGVVVLLGPRVPASLKVFLLTLAVVDDIGAIVVIAVFHAGDVKLAFLLGAVALVGAMLGLRRAGIVRLAPFVALGTGVWLATGASGVHATIAGVVLGLLAPARPVLARPVAGQWDAERLERLLHPWASLAIVPPFALANAGVSLGGDAFDDPAAIRVAAAVVLGLVVGKTVGITAATWLAVRSGVGRLPDGATWPMLAGIAATGGVGFTVALFIGELAFEQGPLQDAAKTGVLAASVLAAVAGAAMLHRACRPTDGCIPEAPPE